MGSALDVEQMRREVLDRHAREAGYSGVPVLHVGSVDAQTIVRAAMKEMNAALEQQKTTISQQQGEQ